MTVALICGSGDGGGVMRSTSSPWGRDASMGRVRRQHSATPDVGIYSSHPSIDDRNRWPFPAGAAVSWRRHDQTNPGRTCRRSRAPHPRRDRAGLAVLFCGINPGLYSARSGTTSPGPATASGRPCIARLHRPAAAPRGPVATCWGTASASPTWSPAPPPPPPSWSPPSSGAGAALVRGRRRPAWLPRSSASTRTGPLRATAPGPRASRRSRVAHPHLGAAQPERPQRALPAGPPRRQFAALRAATGLDRLSTMDVP